MSAVARLHDFVPGTTILSGEVDEEFNQLITLLSGSSNFDVAMRNSHASNPVLNLNQQNTGTAALLIKGQQNAADTFKVKANGYIVGYPRILRTSTVNVGNVGGGTDVLDSYNLPLASLLTNQDRVAVYYTGAFSSNDNDKRLQLVIAGTTAWDTGLFDVDAQGWSMMVTGNRTDSTHIQFNISMIAGSLYTTSGSTIVAGPVGIIGNHVRACNAFSITVSDLATNTVNFTMNGEGTSDNDVSVNSVEVSVVQMS